MVFLSEVGGRGAEDRRGGGEIRDPSSVVGHLDAVFDNESDQVPKGRSVDALALRGDEGRGTLR